MSCGACGTENAVGAKFCSECGATLARECPSCSAPLAVGAKFCSECGADVAMMQQEVVTPAKAAPVAERRLVSVLFADLVGFTTASEGRDAEDTRELLTRYFDASRTIIERYGGTVEKFIGDAVMAVWGAPVANEDDAERAVRAALELVAAVPGLDPALEGPSRRPHRRSRRHPGRHRPGHGRRRPRQHGEPHPVGSRARHRSCRRDDAARSRGGDRLRRRRRARAEGQSGARTFSSRAIRVAAQRRGEGRAVGLEAPFVGRDGELRLVKDLFHAPSTSPERGSCR